MIIPSVSKFSENTFKTFQVLSKFPFKTVQKSQSGNPKSINFSRNQIVIKKSTIQLAKRRSLDIKATFGTVNISLICNKAEQHFYSLFFFLTKSQLKRIKVKDFNALQTTKETSRKRIHFYATKNYKFILLFV